MEQCIEAATAIEKGTDVDLVKIGFWLRQCGAAWDPIVLLSMSKETPDYVNNLEQLEEKYRQLNSRIANAGLEDFHAVKALIDGKII